MFLLQGGAEQTIINIIKYTPLNPSDTGRFLISFAQRKRADRAPSFYFLSAYLSILSINLKLLLHFDKVSCLL